MSHLFELWQLICLLVKHRRLRGIKISKYVEVALESAVILELLELRYPGKSSMWVHAPKHSLAAPTMNGSLWITTPYTSGSRAQRESLLFTGTYEELQKIVVGG